LGVLNKKGFVERRVLFCCVAYSNFEPRRLKRIAIES